MTVFFPSELEGSVSDPGHDYSSSNNGTEKANNAAAIVQHIANHAVARMHKS